MTEDWQTHISRIEQLARAQGLKYHPVEFEVVPESFMTEIATSTPEAAPLKSEASARLGCRARK